MNFTNCEYWSACRGIHVCTFCYKFERETIMNDDLETESPDEQVDYGNIYATGPTCRTCGYVWEIRPKHNFECPFCGEIDAEFDFE